MADGRRPRPLTVILAPYTGEALEGVAAGTAVGHLGVTVKRPVSTSPAVLDKTWIGARHRWDKNVNKLITTELLGFLQNNILF